MKKASKLLLALLFTAIAAIVFIGCPTDGGGGDGYKNPTTSSTSLQTFYIKVVDSTRTNEANKDLSTTNRLHLKLPMGAGFKIQKIFVSDTKSASVPADATVWYDFTKGDTGTDYEVGSYGGTCYGLVSGGTWVVQNADGNIGAAGTVTNGTRDESVGPGGIYAGNVGLAAEGAAYFGFVIANATADLKFNNLRLIFFGTGDVQIGAADASEYFGIAAGGTVQTNDYTVTFDKNGGATEASPQTITITSPPATTVGTLPVAPTRAGYLFAGWNTANDGSGTAFTATTPVTASITVFAQWSSAGGSVVTFNINGGDEVAGTIWGNRAVPVTKVVETSGDHVDALPIAPTKANNLFRGWNTAANGTGTAFTATTPVTEDITVYAQWILAYTDLRNWTIAWLPIDPEAAAIHVHVGDDTNEPGYIEIQKIFVNTSKTLTGAVYIFDATDDPSFVLADDGGNVYWQNGLLGDADDPEPIEIEWDGTGYSYKGGFGTSAIGDAEATYFGLIIKTNTQNTDGLSDIRIQVGDDYLWANADWEFVDLP